MKSETVKIPLIIKEEDGVNRSGEPVTTGVPFPKGLFFKLSEIDVIDRNSAHIPFGAQVLDTWPDGSLKWVLFDIQVSMASNNEEHFFIVQAGSKKTEIISVEESSRQFIVRNQENTYHIDRKIFTPFQKVVAGGQDIIADKGAALTLTGDGGVMLTPVIENSSVETLNEIKAVLYFEGSFKKGSYKNGLRFQARLFFHGGQSFVKVEFSVWNPNAAVHPEGFWDLGDPGSIYFKDLSLDIPLNTESRVATTYKPELSSPAFLNSDSPNLVIYQDSSGGENWNSKNHLNRRGRIPVSFRGYKIYQADQVVHKGLRASPVVQNTNGNIGISGCMPDFWQNFPSAIETRSNVLRLSLFPAYFNDEFEIQAGEQKTHSLYIDFYSGDSPSHSLEWVHTPLLAYTPPEWNCSTGAIPYLLSIENVPQESPFKELFDLTSAGSMGDNTFLDRREIIDEYGWRNFGDIFADHEDRFYKGDKPIISHYNNQYDMAAGFFFQYMRSGDKKWFKLFSELARHVIDIDIYHTRKDRYEYNHGMFWHTDHFASAGTGTHRGFSKEVRIEDKKMESNDNVSATYLHYGGGPSYQHIYSHGLLNYYYLTGDIRAKEAVKELAEYVSNGMDGPTGTKAIVKKMIKNTLVWIKQWQGKEEVRPYAFNDGPGRGAGNSLNTLLDAYKLSKEPEYLIKADSLIRSCIHPKDAIKDRHLHEINMRWAYTIFLQALGKYLDIKAEAKDHDDNFFYARESLLHYAEWMVENEVPILSLSDQFDFPNFSTRAANDIRKACVLMTASKYSPGNNADRFMEKALFFFKESASLLLSYDSSRLTRPMAILMQNINIPLFFIQNPETRYEKEKSISDFGLPKHNGNINDLVNKNIRLALRIFQ